MLNRAVVVDRLGGSGLMTLALRHIISSVEWCPVSLGHWVGGLEGRHVPWALHRNVCRNEGWMDSESHHRCLRGAALVRGIGGRYRWVVWDGESWMGGGRWNRRRDGPRTAGFTELAHNHSEAHLRMSAQLTVPRLMSRCHCVLYVSQG